MLFRSGRGTSDFPPIKLGTSSLKQVDFHCHLGLNLQSDLSWDRHVSSIIAKANKRLGLLKQFKYNASRSALEKCYFAFIRPLLEYGDILFDSCTNELSDKLESVQLEAARLVTGAKRYTSHQALYNELGWVTLEKRRKMHKLQKMYCIYKEACPTYLSGIINDLRPVHTYGTRGSHLFYLNLPLMHKELYKRSFVPSSVNLWNGLQPALKASKSLVSFKSKVRNLHSRIATYFPHALSRKEEVILSQLRLGFSDLNFHLFSKGCVDSAQCSCSLGVETIEHYFLVCPQYQVARETLLTGLRNVVQSNVTPTLLLHGSTTLDNDINLSIIQCTVKFILASNRF